MKNILFISVLFLAVVVSCKKEEKKETPTNKPLEFVSLTASDTNIFVNGLTTLTATATGDGLTYTWTYLYGQIIGSGATVQWTVCHADIFDVTCTIKDSHDSVKQKSIKIYVK